MASQAFFLVLLSTVARALLAHSCGAGLHVVLTIVLPEIPPPLAMAIGLVLAVLLIEVAVHISRGRAFKS